MNEKEKFEAIFNDHSSLKIWEKLENGCYIGTMGYSEENILVLKSLLKSFEEQYGEEIDYEAAKEELLLYEKKGKLFIYFDENKQPISMNGCIYNYENETVEFVSNNNICSLYFYGLSTLPEHRGKGACSQLIQYAIKYAEYNDFDLVYARTDLVNSNSEWLMKNAGMEICKYEGKIIAEWVDVTKNKGDYRLHMWKSLRSMILQFPKEKAVFAEDNSYRTVQVEKQKIKQKFVPASIFCFNE